uniref:Uncharacterized protein n=1 Tax=Candidatus Kentrum sp. LPFa TaxID=2126335 RepID=A0A450WI70_9GAMM|nr:MAG: hypothetical protein BECKLPF1236A_GA0070988_101535 [Candidatus Kentron sp. LPFa]VFK32194.1 MAG: hypothetical protein BECKLPF1236C_GA0070990_101605 [Candidatus Kentron sp. LPFa]
MKSKLFAVSLLSLALTSVPVLADHAGDFWHKDNCPAATKWTDSAGKPIPMDEKFGKGASDITRCLGKTKNAKVLYRINKLCEDTLACTTPYILGNVMNHIADYENHGMDSSDFKIVVTVGDG